MIELDVAVVIRVIVELKVFFVLVGVIIVLVVELFECVRHETVVVGIDSDDP